MPKIGNSVRHIIPVSGKDSLACAIVQMTHKPDLPYELLFCDVGTELPETYEWLDKVEQKLGRKINRVGKSLEEVIAGFGILPGFHHRFCTKNAKIAPMHNWLKGSRAIQYIGFRADEKDRIPPRGNERADIEEKYPLIELGITLPMVYKILEDRDMLPPTFFWQRLYDDVYERVAPVSQRFMETAKPWTKGYLFSWRSRSNCFCCLAGETEVVTADGIKPIRDLVGTEQELLVPKLFGGTKSEVGHLVKAPIRSFGVQRLYKITMARAKAIKEVYATAEHRWIISHGKQYLKVVPEKTTIQLRKGDKLKNLNRATVGSERGHVLKIGAMRGFTFGDGSKPQDNRPGTVDIYEGKDEVFLEMFSAICSGTYYPPDPTAKPLPRNIGCYHFYGLPNDWKEYPSLRESRSFLLGWLSGYFAADGCVSESGQCILSSANPENLEFVRSVCALLGIQCSPVRTQLRKGVKGEWGNLSHVTIRVNDLPLDFFWLTHHHQRAEEVVDRNDRRFGWVVVSVEKTDRVEEVYCATVEGVGAFGLSDGLMTGNCFYQRLYEWVGLLEHHPSLFDKAEEMERVYGSHNSEYVLERNEGSREDRQKDYTWIPNYSLGRVRELAADIFSRRVKQCVDLVVNARHLPDVEIDALSLTSCGAYCGK